MPKGQPKQLIKSIQSIFYSLSGETTSMGARTLFIRCKGCNLRCSYCDTSYAWNVQPINEVNLEDELPKMLEGKNIRYVVLTGGEPLLQFSGFDILLLSDLIIKYNPETILQIETNGSITIPKPMKIKQLRRIEYVMDVKLPSSGMFDKMNLDNLKLLSTHDQVKFVIGSHEDLDVALDICKKYDIKCRNIWFSPVYGEFNAKYLWNVITDIPDDRLRMQIQLHKTVFGQVDFEV